VQMVNDFVPFRMFFFIFNMARTDYGHTKLGANLAPATAPTYCMVKL
jgi:hypothetical protein